MLMLNDGYSRFALACVFQVYECLERAIGLAKERLDVLWRVRQCRQEEDVTGEQAVSKYNKLSSRGLLDDDGDTYARRERSKTNAEFESELNR